MQVYIVGFGPDLELPFCDLDIQPVNKISLIKQQVLRAHDCKYRESLARLKKSKILIICQKNPFGQLSPKKIFLTFKNL